MTRLATNYLGLITTTKKWRQMKNYLSRHTALLVAAVLLSISFWSCSKDNLPEPTPPDISVTGVTLNKAELALSVGGSETLTATVAPAEATNKNVTWKSSNAAIASVDANGKVTGVAAGEATITVTTQDGAKTATCKVTVSETTVAVTGVTLNKTTTSLLVGGSETLTATVAPAEATNKNVTWKSDKPEIASVDANGKVTGVAAGEATITVTTEDGAKTATCKVTVSETTVAVTGVTLNKTTTSLSVGGSETLTATVAPADATNKNVTWKSDKPEIASVDANGKVTGVAAGEATITVTTQDGAKTATCKVTVSETTVAVTGVTLNKTTLTLETSASETLTATIAPADATNQNVTWKSDKPEIASVDANGKVTGVAAGEATITVTTQDGAKTATCKVTVSETTVAVTGVTLNKTTLTLETSASETLTATIAPADATNQNVTWKSDKPEIASVDANGKVTGVAVGEATITVTTQDGGKTATCKVTVKAATIAVTGVTLNKTTLTLETSASETLTATVAPAEATNKNVTWKSSNAAIASVDANGKVTGVAVGEATITVTTQDGGKTATCKVTVKAATIAVTGVTLNKTTLTLETSASETLTATVAPAEATNKNVTWKSDKPEIASVDATGKVTGVKAGEATITVTTQDGAKTATCKVTVLPKAVSEITLAALAIYVGESKAITATVKPDDATNKALTWKSSDETVATVDATGKVTGIKTGTATITATAQDGSGVSGSCTVTVLSPVKKVTVEPANLTLGQNKSYTLKATVEVFSSGTDTGVTWTSSDTTIATVDATGKVTATDKTGTVTITATSKADPAKKGTCTIKVSADQTDIDFGDYGPGEEW